MDQNVSERKPKTSKSRRETAVQGTNDNSIVSKCSMSAAGYFPDHFLQHFVAKHAKRAPLINRGYYLRAACIDNVLQQFLAQNAGCKKQIISLGAGFDSTYFRLKADGLLQDASFYEVDFPEVVKKKHAIIQSHDELISLIQLDGQDSKIVPPIELSSPDYCLLGVDLTQLNTLEAALRLCGADFDTQTLLLSECVMTYMTRRCSSALVKWAGETFQDAFFVMFEQINPDDAFGQFMRHHFHTIGSPLKCITSFPTLESQNKRFLGLGWSVCKSYDLNEIYRHILSREERARIETLDPFDEYEEFNLKCAHYFLLVASTSDDICDQLFGISSSVEEQLASQLEQITDLITVATVASDHVSVKRFSHTSVLVNGRYAVTTGGFGEVDGRHQRVQEVSVTDTVTMETKLVRCHSEDIQYSRMHHASVVLSDGRILLCGGRQSPFFLCSQLLLLDLQIDSDTDPGPVRSNTQTCTNSCSCRNRISMNCESGRAKYNRTDGVNSDDGNLSNGVCNLCGERNSFNHQSEESNCSDQHSNKSKASWTESSNLHPMDAVHPSKEHREDLNPRVHAATGAVNSNSGCMHKGVKPNSSVILVERDECTEFEGGRLRCAVMLQMGDVPCPRWRHACTLVEIDGCDFVLLHGGRTQKAEVLADTYLLDVQRGVWTKILCTGDIPGPRHSHTLVTLEESGGSQQVVMVGGMDEDQTPQTSMYLLEVASATWSLLSVTGHQLPRYSHTCHVVGDKLVLVGGVNQYQQTPGVGVINLTTGVSQEFAFPSFGQERLLMFHRHCSVLLPDNKIVVLGGGGNCFSFGTHLNHTPVTLDVSNCLCAFD